MMDMVVFYSWQNDRPPAICRYFVRDALQKAVSRIAHDSSVEECPRLEYDTRGQSGIPAIAETIFKKIENSAVFLGDITFVGTSETLDGSPEKALPNPNVLMELGYAGKAIGWERIICVFNDHYGSIENQIFNLRHRRNPIRYHLGPDKVDKEVQYRLSTDIENAIRSILWAEHQAVDDLLAKLDAYSLTFVKIYASVNLITPRSTNSFTLGVPINDLDTPGFNAAVTQLRQLGVIRTVVDETTHSIGFQWTYMGILMLRKLGFK